VLNTWDRPADGTLDTATGTSTLSVPLNSDVYLTSNAVQACPRCSATGTPENPGTGTCDRGPRQGQTCVTTSSTGLTRDCPTGGADATRPCTAGGGNCIDGSHVGPIKVDLTPLTTGNVTQNAAADGTFCAGQFGTGCFGSAACRAITETGSPAGPVTPGTPANVTLASVFCIAKTGNGIVDGAANLPGPGAVSLPGAILIRNLGGSSTTFPSVTSTTVTPTTSSTTTSTTNPCGNGVLDAGEQCDGAAVPCADGVCDPIDCQCRAQPRRVLDFTNGSPVNSCGDTRDAQDGVLANLLCGGLNIGGGSSLTPEGPTPDGSTSRFLLDCNNNDCTINPFAVAPRQNSADPDCSTTGCNFGTPLPIINPLGAAFTTCVLNTFSTPVSGNIDLATGQSTTSIVLNSDIFTAAQDRPTEPCPKCSATGTLANPGHGTCNSGPRAGQDCTSTNSSGLTRDCLPGGVGPGASCEPGGNPCADGTSHVGAILVDLSPLSTGTVSKSAADGLFCKDLNPPQGAPQVGCFGKPDCRKITENGVPGGAITLNTPANATLASVFCIAATQNGLVNGAAGLPGPGAVSLPGTYVMKELN